MMMKKMMLKVAPAAALFLVLSPAPPAAAVFPGSINWNRPTTPTPTEAIECPDDPDYGYPSDPEDDSKRAIWWHAKSRDEKAEITHSNRKFELNAAKEFNKNSESRLADITTDLNNNYAHRDMVIGQLADIKAILDKKYGDVRELIVQHDKAKSNYIAKNHVLEERRKRIAAFNVDIEGSIPKVIDGIQVDVDANNDEVGRVHGLFEDLTGDFCHQTADILSKAPKYPMQMESVDSQAWSEILELWGRLGGEEESQEAKKNRIAAIFCDANERIEEVFDQELPQWVLDREFHNHFVGVFEDASEEMSGTVTGIDADIVSVSNDLAISDAALEAAPGIIHSAEQALADAREMEAKYDIEGFTDARKQAEVDLELARNSQRDIELDVLEKRSDLERLHSDLETAKAQRDHFSDVHKALTDYDTRKQILDIELGGFLDRGNQLQEKIEEQERLIENLRGEVEAVQVLINGDMEAYNAATNLYTRLSAEWSSYASSEEEYNALIDAVQLNNQVYESHRNTLARGTEFEEEIEVQVGILNERVSERDVAATELADLEGAVNKENYGDCVPNEDTICESRADRLEALRNSKVTAEGDEAGARGTLNDLKDAAANIENNTIANTNDRIAALEDTRTEFEALLARATERGVEDDDLFIRRTLTELEEDLTDLRNELQQFTDDLVVALQAVDDQRLVLQNAIETTASRSTDLENALVENEAFLALVAIRDTAITLLAGNQSQVDDQENVLASHRQKLCDWAADYPRYETAEAGAEESVERERNHFNHVDTWVQGYHYENELIEDLDRTLTYIRGEEFNKLSAELVLEESIEAVATAERLLECARRHSVLVTSSPTSQPTPEPTSTPTRWPTPRPNPQCQVSEILNPGPEIWEGPSPLEVVKSTLRSVVDSVPVYTGFIRGCGGICMTPAPTSAPTPEPTDTPTKTPTTLSPTKKPTGTPTKAPTKAPTGTPTKKPTGKPTKAPTGSPTTDSPTTEPPTVPAPLFCDPTTGIMNKDLNACCPIGCGQCGGGGCSKAPLGKQACCNKKITAEGRICTGPLDTQCVIPDV
jgi:hypothetical protein